MVNPARDTGLSLHQLEKRYGDVRAVCPMDLSIAEGEFVVLLGPSGCGKTTVLRMIAGLEEPTGGRITIDGVDITDREPADRDVAMVFQNYALYPHMTVRDNLGFGLKMRGTSAIATSEAVTRAARVLDLASLLDRKPGQLSGGQRQRVALGRALVREPRIFLFDEPLSNLDARLRVDLRTEIAELHARVGATMVYVTHDQTEAMTLGQRIAVMESGVLRQYAPPLDIYRRPADLFVARFVGSPALNVVRGQLTETGNGKRFEAPGGWALPPSPGTPNGVTTLGVRPEDVDLVDAEAPDAHVRATIARLEQLGSDLLVHVTVAQDDAWVVRAAPDARCRLGDTVGLHVRTAQALWFDGSGARVMP